MPKAADDPTCTAKISFIEPSRGDGFVTHDDNFPARFFAFPAVTWPQASLVA